MNRIAALATAAAVAASVVVGVGGWDLRLAGSPAYALVPPDFPAPTSSPSPSPTATRHRPACPATARRFAPRRISMPGIIGKTSVVTPPRVGGVPGAPPLTSTGKWQFAWDRKWPVRPGDRHGNVLLNAHVWPDGSALGNRLLRELHRGDRIVVRGRHHRKLCYRVTERIQVYPRQALRRYYRNTGRPHLAIVVCSGRRLGAGVWEKRTIWFAAPRT